MSDDERPIRRVMKFGVVGSRNFTDERLMRIAYGQLTLSLLAGGTARSVDAIVSGGAEGADRLASVLAFEKEMEYIEHLPDKERYGWPRAAFERNQLIVDDSDVLLAFFGPGEPPSVNKSGTMDTVRRAIKKRIPIHMYFQKEE